MCTIKVGWVFLDRTRILSGIKFTTHFIEILVVQTKRFGGRFVNVILTHQTCRRAAESKRRALGNYFIEWICYRFLTSKFRGTSDLCLRTTLGLAFEGLRRSGDPEKTTCFDAGKIGFCHCTLVLQTQVPKLCTHLHLSLLCIWYQEHIANSLREIVS